MCCLICDLVFVLLLRGWFVVCRLLFVLVVVVFVVSFLVVFVFELVGLAGCCCFGFGGCLLGCWFVAFVVSLLLFCFCCWFTVSLVGLVD